MDNDDSTNRPFWCVPKVISLQEKWLDRLERTSVDIILSFCYCLQSVTAWYRSRENDRKTVFRVNGRADGHEIHLSTCTSNHRYFILKILSNGVSHHFIILWILLVALRPNTFCGIFRWLSEPDVTRNENFTGVLQIRNRKCQTGYLPFARFMPYHWLTLVTTVRSQLRNWASSMAQPLTQWALLFSF